MTPEINQSDAEHIHAATTNSFLILGRDNSRSAGVAPLVDETSLGGGNPIDVTQECVSPKTEELDPPKIEVEDVSDDNSDNKGPIGSYVSSEV